MNRPKAKKLAALDNLLKDLHAVSVITFLPVFIYLPPTAYFAVNGKPGGLMIVAPWLAPMIAYWYWRFKYHRARCKRYSKEGNILEYEKALKVDSVRTILIGGAVNSTLFFFLFGGGSGVLYAALFMSSLCPFSIIVGFSYLSYWWNTRKTT